jgi:hypothetical protein
MAERPDFIQYEGVDLLSLRFSGMSVDEVRDYLEASKAVISKQPLKSVLFLVDVTGLNYNLKSIRDFTNFSRFNGEFSKATAVIGLTSEMRMLYKAALAMSGRDKSTVRFFSSGEENVAKAWLKGIIDKEEEEKKKLQAETAGE